MSNLYNTQIWEQIQELVTVEAIQDFFGYSNEEAVPLIDNLGDLFGRHDIEEARSFLSYLIYK